MQRVVVLLIGMVLALARTGHAQRLALEAYQGPRPPGANRVMELIRRELSTRYHVQPAVLAQLLADHLPAPGQQDPRYDSAAFVAEVRAGSEAYSNAEFRKAERLLDTAIAHGRRNPALIVRDPAAQAAMRRALVYAALVNKRLAEDAREQWALAKDKTAQGKLDETTRHYQSKRDAWLGELLRSYAAVPVSRDEFGREAEQLYLQAVRTWSQAARGTLEVRLSEPIAMLTLAINETTAPLGVTPNLLPGTYRVLAQAPAGAREYQVTVRPGEQASLVIDWELDALMEGREWVGLRYSNEAQAQTEGQWVARLLRGTSVSEAVVFTISATGRKHLVTATLYAASGDRARQQTLELDSLSSSRNPERIRHFLLSLEATAPNPPPVLTPTESAPAQHTTDVALSAPSKTPARGWLAPTLVVGGAAAVALGGVLYHYGARPADATNTQSRYLFGSKPWGLATGLAGLAAVGVGVWLWRRPHPSSATTLRASPTGVELVGVF